MKGYGNSWTIVCDHLIKSPQRNWNHQQDGSYLCDKCIEEKPDIKDLHPLSMESISDLRRNRDS